MAQYMPKGQPQVFAERIYRLADEDQLRVCDEVFQQAIESGRLSVEKHPYVGQPVVGVYSVEVGNTIHTPIPGNFLLVDDGESLSIFAPGAFSARYEAA